MTKEDRAKMFERLHRALPWMMDNADMEEDLKILGPDNQPLYIDGVAQFAEVTCGQCAHAKPMDAWSIICWPPRPIWERDRFPPVTSRRHKDESAEGCACFAKRVAVDAGNLLPDNASEATMNP